MLLNSCLPRVFMYNAHLLCFSLALQVSVCNLGASGSLLQKAVSFGALSVTQPTTFAISNRPLLLLSRAVLLSCYRRKLFHVGSIRNYIRFNISLIRYVFAQILNVTSCNRSVGMP
jgi:hypothetical protein